MSALRHAAADEGIGYLLEDQAIAADRNAIPDEKVNVSELDMPQMGKAGGLSQSAPQRDQAIDIFKGMLVLGMVYCHVLQFFSDTQLFASASYWIEAMNLITFSGFVFSFGYASQLAYYSKPLQRAAPRMAVAALKTLIAFYMSGLAYRIYIDGRAISWSTLKPIILLDDMPGWSEFLISFTYLTLVGLILFKPLKWLVERRRIALLTAAALLAATWMPYGSIHVTQLGPLVGTRDFASFPVLQYFPYYLTGMLFARYRIGWDWRVLTASAAATGLFVWRWLQEDALPERFPPSIWWIIGAAFLLYLYYLIARYVGRYMMVSAPIEAMGRNVLWFLIMSNLLIFSLKSRHGDLLFSPLEGFIMTVLLLAFSGFGIWIIAKKTAKHGLTKTTT